MSLIPKGAKFSNNPADMRGITVIPTCAKILMNVLTERLMSVPLHKAQHGFVRQLSTLHAIAALKLRVRKARLEGRRLIVAYLDVEKAYDSIDRRAVLYALREFGAGDSTLRLFEFLLEHERTTLKLSGRHTKTYFPRRGVRQGDPASPTLFDFIMDLVVREFIRLRPDSDIPILYADDTALSSEDRDRLQADLDAFAAAMARYGMRLNVKKTKYQVFLPVKNRTANRVYAPGDSFKRFKKEQVTCVRCGRQISRGMLKRHQRTATCATAAGVGVPSAFEDTRAVDITSSDDEPFTAKNAKRIALQRFHVGGSAMYIEMAKDEGNPPTACPRCRGVPFLSTSRVRMNKHLQKVHGCTAVYVPLGAHSGKSYVTCDACGAAVLQPFLRKHYMSTLCQDLRSLHQARYAKKVAFAPVQPLVVYGVAIERVHEFRYLGVWLVSQGGDELTIERNRLRACKAYGGMRDLIKSPNFRMNQRRQLIGVVVMASLLYACETWALTKTTVSRLRSSQQSLLRPASLLSHVPQPDGSIHAPSVAEVLRVTGATDVESLARRRRLKFAVKVFCDPQCLAHSWAVDAVASVRRFTGLTADWLDQVRSDAKLVGIVLGSRLTTQLAANIDAFDFVGRPLTAA
jgi:hypothetical protein